MTVTEARGEGNADSDAESRVRRLVEGVIGVPATEGNEFTVLRNGDEIFPALLAAIDDARKTIDFLTFVYWRGAIGRTFAHHLVERARDGVRVRVLLDAWGANSMEPAVIALLQQNRVDVQWFRPLRRFRPGEVNHRTHRKVLIVDEAIGFTGGVGIADEWCGDARSANEWRDTHFRIRGPAVDGLRAAFLDNWAETDQPLFALDADRFPEQPQPGRVVAQCVRGAAETGWSDVATLFRTLLQSAQQRVRIATAYFVPDAALTDWLTTAATRGVSIEILLPGPHADKRLVQVASEASYDQLLEAGVRIFTYQPSMMHAKIMTIDGITANIGSANLNARSTQLDEEINVVAIDRDLVEILDSHFDDDLARSVEIKLGRWRRRSFTQRTYEVVSQPFRRLF